MSLSFLGRMPPWLRAVICGVLGVAIGYLVSWTAGATNLERSVYDVAVCLSPEAQRGSLDSVVMVEIDAVTLSEYFDPDPYPISAHLNVHTRFVEQLHRAGARTVAFDILFDQVDGLLGLEQFAAACSVSGNVVLAAGLEGESADLLQNTPPWRELSLLLPVERLQQVCAYALTNMPSDMDGVIRRCRKGTRFFDSVYLFMPCYLSRIGDITSDPETTTPLINYPRSQAALIRRSGASILRGEGLDELTGKIVIIGVEDTKGADRYITPYSRLPELTGMPTLSGLAILANATQTTMDGSVPFEISRHASALLLVPLMIAWSGLLLQLRVWLNVLLFWVLAAAVVAVTITTVIYFNLVPPSSTVTACLLATHIAAALMLYVIVRQRATDMREELEEGRKVQQAQLPKKLPAIPGLRLAAQLVPSLQVAGDYYDVFQLDDHSLGLLIADVSGKGTPAGMVMSNLHATLHAVRDDYRDPARVLSDLNTALCEWLSPGTFVTALYAIIDRSVPECRYACAGHNPPYLIRPGGDPQALSEGGLILGAVPNPGYRETTVPLAAGDTLFIYTDGLSEAANHRGKEFGDEVMLAQFEQLAGGDPQVSLDRLFAALEGFHGRKHLDDDTTVVIIGIDQ